MAIAAELSVQLGYLSLADRDRLLRIIQTLHLPIKAPQWETSQYLSYMSHDKKAESGQIKYIVLEKLGQAKVQKVADDLVVSALRVAGAI